MTDSPLPAGAPRRAGHHVPGALYGAIVVLLLAGTIGLGAAAGAWQTSGRTSSDGQPVTPQGVSATEVKGWMAVGDVAAAWDVPLPELLGAFDLPADTPPSTQVKDLDGAAFSVSALRDWLAVRSP